MSKKNDKINERKKEINDLCTQLKWAYRGYYTPLTDFVSCNNNNNDIEEFCKTVLAYNKNLDKKHYSLYFSYLVSSICFIKNYCRPSDLHFYSLVKIALSIEDCANGNIVFKKSTYGYMWEPYLNAKRVDITEKLGHDAAKEFSTLYDDSKLDKTQFANELIALFDELLFDHNKSFLIDSNYEIATSSLNRYIGSTKHSLRKFLIKDVDNA